MKRKLFTLAWSLSSLALAQPTLTSTIYKGTTPNPAQVVAGDVLTHVVEINNTSGANPSSPVNLSATISGIQTLSGTTGTQGWTPLSAWIGGQGPATAQWNNLTPVSGSMSPMFGKNKFKGTGDIAIGNLSLGSGGDGYDPIVYVTPSGAVIIMAIHHHTPTTNALVCYNLTTSQSCLGATLRPTDFTTGNRSNGIIVGTKLYYPGGYHPSVSSTTNAIPALGCFDLSALPSGNLLPCTTPVYGIGNAGQYLEQDGSFHKIESLVEIGGKIYTVYLPNGTSTSYLTCFDPATEAICSGYPMALMKDATTPFPRQFGYGYNGSIIPMGNNKLAISSHLYSDTPPICIDVVTQTNCNGTSPVRPLPLLPSERLEGALTPTLDVNGNINGFCGARSWGCFDYPSYTHYYNDVTSRYPGFQLINNYNGTEHNQVAGGTYMVDTVNARLHFARGLGNSMVCYDFRTLNNCADFGEPSAPYGMKQIPNTNCIVTYGDLAEFKLFTHNNTFSTYDQGTCKLFANFDWTVANPSSYFCDPTTETILWDTLEVKALPSGHTGGQAQVMTSTGTLLKKFNIPSGASSIKFPSAGGILNDSIPYATYPNLKVKLTINGLSNVTQTAEVYLSYAVSGNKKPQFCFQSVACTGIPIDTTGTGMAALELQNHITLSVGIALSGSSPNMTTFVTDPVCVLPIEWGEFNGYVQEGIAYLNWTTLYEQNNRGFEIQKSLDANTYETVAFIQSQGNSNTTKNYSYKDYSLKGRTYYRIRQVDFDGKSSNSSILELTNSTSNVSLFPNPSDESINISIPNLSDTHVIINNSLGEVMYEQTLNDYNTVIDIKSWKQGIYLVVIKSAVDTQVIKLVKQ